MCSIKTRARAPVMGYGLCAFSSLLIKHTPLNSFYLALRVRERLSTMLRFFALSASTESRRASSSRLLEPTRALIGRSVEIFPPTAQPCMEPCF